MRLILASTILLFSQSVWGQKTIKLIGKVDSVQNKTIYFNQFKNNQLVHLDSVKLNKKGKFKFKLNITDPKEFYSLSFSPKNYALLILDSSNTDKKIVFHATSPNISKNYTIEGSLESKNIIDFTNLVNNFQKQLDSVKTLYKDSADRGEKAQNKLYESFIQQRNNFIESHPKSLALLITTSYFNPKTELKWFKKIEKEISVSGANAKYHDAIKGQIQQIEKAMKPQVQRPTQDVNIGKTFTELNFPSPDGKIITMESLRGKYVLVDFWASWCRPCRNENPNVVRLYNKYKDAGFTVYSVSLDKNKDRWIKAIQQDNLSWPNHVSDLKGWRTEATKIYQFRGIPYTMLVDKEGKIIATKLRGKQLEDTLKSIFGF